MPKLKQKVAGAVPTPEAAAAFCTIRSYLPTLRKQSDQSLVVTFQGEPPEAILSR
jgi:transposase